MQATRTVARSMTATDPRLMGSEIQLHSDLLAASEIDDAVRLAEARVPFRRREGRQAAVILEVEGIEHFARHAERHSEDRNALLDPEVDAAIGEAPCLGRIKRSRVCARVDAVLQAEAFREIEQVRRAAAAEREDGAEARIP